MTDSTFEHLGDDELRSRLENHVAESYAAWLVDHRDREDAALVIERILGGR